jgi:hypothetical protein
MSIIKSIMQQIGLSPDPAKNFNWSVPNVPDGTAKLARGNAGTPTQDIMTVAADGKVAFPNTKRAWNPVSPLPAFDTAYVNNTEYEQMVSAVITTAIAGSICFIEVVGPQAPSPGVQFGYITLSAGQFTTILAVVPQGHSWFLRQENGVCNVTKVYLLRV